MPGKVSTGKAREAAEPRYMQLASELRKAVMEGQFSLDKSFPTESELCRKYQASRFTIREALRRLQAEGLIARKRGSGTVVQPAAARGGALHQPLSNVGELLQYARDTQVTYKPRKSGPLQEEIAEQVAEDTGGNWHSVHGARRHPDDALPIAVTDAFFHERLGDVMDQLDLGAGPLFSQLEIHAGVRIAKVTQDIQAIAAGEQIARELGVEPNSPILRILRCYFDNRGNLFEVSVSYHPGDRFAYSMHIDVDG